MTLVKSLRGRGFAGMLPRTMSQGNDAFTPKDAASDASKEPPPEESAKTDSAKTDSAKTDSAKTDSGSDSQRAKRNAKERDEEARDDEARDEEARDDEARDDEARDDEARDEDERAKKGPSGTARRAASKSSRRASRDDDEDERLVPPQTEEEIDVPKKYTIYMLGAMSTLTVILWFAARLTCNVHPDQVREPKHFSTRDLAADPKNAAMEFHHKFETGDFITAFDLSTGEMKNTVEAKLKECEQNADDCANNQKKLAGSVESTGKVLERDANRASVELLSVYKNASGQKTFAFDVVKEGEFWRVASRHEIATAPVQQVPTPAAPSGPAAAAPAPVEMSDQSSSQAP